MINKKITTGVFIILLSLLFSICIFASDPCQHLNAPENSDCSVSVVCVDCGKELHKATKHSFRTTNIVPNEKGAIYGLTRYSACQNDGCSVTTTEEQSVFVKQIGYSAGGTSITASYAIDFEILSDYANGIKASFEYGYVAGSKLYIGDQFPLTQNGKPLDYVSKTKINNYFNDVYDFNLIGLDRKHLDVEFLLAIYVIFNNQAYYFQGSEVITAPDQFKYVTFNGLKQDDEGFGNFDFSETEESADRLKQQNNSKNNYNIGSSYDDGTLTKFESTANSLSLGSLLLSFPNSSNFMTHYLSGTGENFTLNLDAFFKNEIALANRNDDINNVLTACEAIASLDSTISFYQTTQSLHHNLEGDWKYCLGSYFTSIKVENLTITYNAYGEKFYSATITYIVKDFYNWNENDHGKVFSLISPHELHQLHKAGMAKEFLTYGEKTYTLKWADGIRAEELNLQ